MRRYTVLAALGLEVACACADTLMVPDDYATIQAAIEAAASGDTVLVRAGHYTSDLNFDGKSLSVISLDGPSETTIESGNDTFPGASIKSIAEESAAIEGFTIIQGRYLHPAILVAGGRVTIRNCDFPTINGFPAVEAHNATVLIENCRISRKQIAIRATGAQLTMRQCQILDGLGAMPPGIWATGTRTELVGCLFANNRVLAVSEFPGGAILHSGNELIVTDCVFTDNGAQWGGAVAVYSNAEFRGCRFIANLGHTAGGAMLAAAAADVTVRDCVFVQNRSQHGAAIAHQGTSAVNVYNSVFLDNWAAVQGALAVSAEAGALRITNCSANHRDLPPGVPALFVDVDAKLAVANSVLWGDGSALQIGGPGATVVSYSNVRGGWPGEGNLSADPRFADDDLRLLSQSPCVDRGSNGAVPTSIAEDRDGCPRFIDDLTQPDCPAGGCGAGPIVDIGAYERTCAGDLDGNFVPGELGDLEILLDSFGRTDVRRCQGDLNADGVVDLRDLGAFLALGRGSCP